jgi:hypothetical protein
VTFGGRTDNAQLQATLVTVLTDMFPEELLEQQFGEAACVLYGEGYGAKIQKSGGNYRPDQSFVLFDVKVGDWWLRHDDVCDVAAKLGVDQVPVVFGQASVTLAIRAVEDGLWSRFGDFYAEGLVGRPPMGILGRNGDRLLMKVKHADFFGRAS